ncbi:MAG: hypothetical protein U9R03_02835 [Candidatus Aerophobetes bacterium]|nr:hypothetical protein [Candidatus Aerophobetes bacterium]
MACINPDGTLTSSGKKILSALSSPATLEKVAKSTKLPLFRIRSSIREMLEAGLVKEEKNRYLATKLGQEKIRSS